MKPAEKISKAITRLIMLNPFFGVLLSSLEKIEDSSIYCNGKPTFATDGFKIYYHPDAVNSYSLPELESILLHEVLHGIFGHCLESRRGDRDPDIWNFACDIVVNLEIKVMGYTLPQNACIEGRFVNMLPEEIYEKLAKKIGVFIKKFDIHLTLSKKESSILKERILTAYDMSKTSIGELPLGVVRAIKEIQNSCVNWQKIFHYITGQVLTRDELNYNLPNKKYLPYEIYLPSLKTYATGNLVIAIDTSGSITTEQLTQFASEVKKISHLAPEILVLTCDAEVHEVVKVEQFQDFLSKIQFIGFGGTDFGPVFEYVKKERLNPDLLIYLTDGQGRYPNSRPRYPVLWALTQDCDVPWGMKILLSRKSLTLFILSRRADESQS